MKPKSACWMVCLLVWGAWVGSASAFTPRTRDTVVEKSVSLMPGALARQLRRNTRALHEGALAGLDRTGIRRELSDSVLVGRALESEVKRTIGLLDDHAPMREVVRAFGRLAQLTTDLSFALNVCAEEPREDQFFDDFASYVERKLPKIAVTFEGYAEPHLARGDIPGFAAAIAAAARRDYGGIVRSYFPVGRSRHPSDFDERSVAFAAASLETSLAVTSTARVWLYVWQHAGGDLTGTPFLESARWADPFAQDQRNR